MLGKVFETKTEFIAGFKEYIVPVGFKVKVINVNNSSNNTFSFNNSYTVKVLNNVCNNFKKGDTPRIREQTFKKYFKKIIQNNIKKI